jgi:hypothetical protein
MSVNGFIADRDGRTDFLVSDPSYHPAPFFVSIDSVIMGRVTYEGAVRQGMRAYEGLRNYVVSRRLSAADFPEVTMLRDVPCCSNRCFKKVVVRCHAKTPQPQRCRRDACRPGSRDHIPQTARRWRRDHGDGVASHVEELDRVAFLGECRDDVALHDRGDVADTQPALGGIAGQDRRR